MFAYHFPTLKKAKSAMISRNRAPGIAFPIALALTAIAAPGARAVMPQATDLSAQEIWQQSLRASVEVLDEARGDVDGDGLEETAICYKLPPAMQSASGMPGTTTGGLVVFSGNKQIARPVFHTLFSDGTCQQLALNRGALKFRSPQPEAPEEPKEYRWSFGKDFYFPKEQQGHLTNAVGQRGADIESVRALQDGRFETAWVVAEGSTGIGNKLQLRFQAPVRIGLVGVFGGVGSNYPAYRHNNRLHRISVRTKSALPVGAESSQRKKVLVADAPRISYFVPPQAGVPMSGMEIRVEGVHLGKRANDTKVGEFEIVPIMELRSGVGVAGGFFRTSKSIRDRGVAEFGTRGAARGPAAKVAAPSGAAPLFQTTNLKKLQTLETELDDSDESFEMDDF